MDDGVTLLLELANVLRQITEQGTQTVTRSVSRDRRTRNEEPVEDPWAAPVDEVEEDDPWGTPSKGGKFPSYKELIGCLLLLEHVSIDQVKGYEAKPGDPLVDQLSADTAVIDGPEDCPFVGQEFPEFWWNQTSIVKDMQSTLRKDKSAILGRLARVDNKKTSNTYREVYRTPEEAEEAVNARGRQSGEFPFILEMPSDEDKALARKFLKETRGAKR